MISPTPLFLQVLLLFSSSERKELKEMKVYFQNQQNNTLKALRIKEKEIMLFKSKKTTNASTPAQHRKTIITSGLSFQRSLDTLLMPRERTEPGHENMGAFCWDLPRWHSDKEATYQCRRQGFDPWVRKIPWRRKWQPTPVVLPRKSHRGSWGLQSMESQRRVSTWGQFTVL